jgi:hypothetical protein
MATCRQNREARELGKSMRIMPVVAITISAFCCAAGGADRENPDKSDVTAVVNEFCDCAGFYQAGALIAESGTKPATAEKMRGLARGAEFVAHYLLAHEYAASHDKPRPYGDFKSYTEGRVEGARNLVLSMVEGEDHTAFNAQLKKCEAMQELQEEIVQKMRDESIGR